jgi:hypothetical protein
MWVSCSLVSASKTTISSSRLRNSGLKLARTAAITDSRCASRSSVGSVRNIDPRFEVRITMVLRKSPVRP